MYEPVLCNIKEESGILKKSYFNGNELPKIILMTKGYNDMKRKLLTNENRNEAFIWFFNHVNTKYHKILEKLKFRIPDDVKKNMGTFISEMG